MWNSTVEVSGLRVTLIASSAQTSVDWFDRSDRACVQWLLPVWMASGSAPLHGTVSVTFASCSSCIPFHSVLLPSHWLPGFPRQVALNLDLSVDHRNRHFLLKMWADERSEKISGHGLPDTETEGYQRWSLLRGPSWLVSSLCRETACLSQGCRFQGHLSYQIPAGGNSPSFTPLSSDHRNICRRLISSDAPQGGVLRFGSCIILDLCGINLT